MGKTGSDAWRLSRHRAGSDRLPVRPGDRPFELSVSRGLRGAGIDPARLLQPDRAGRSDAGPRRRGRLAVGVGGYARIDAGGASALHRSPGAATRQRARERRLPADVLRSGLEQQSAAAGIHPAAFHAPRPGRQRDAREARFGGLGRRAAPAAALVVRQRDHGDDGREARDENPGNPPLRFGIALPRDLNPVAGLNARSEEHTSELQSHSFISYAVFCFKKKQTHRLTFSVTPDRTSSGRAKYTPLP